MHGAERNMNKSGNANFQRLNKSKFSITALTDDLDDRDYWFSRSPIKRLEHLEMLRALNYGRLAASRLQRFFKVAELS